MQPSSAYARAASVLPESQRGNDAVARPQEQPSSEEIKAPRKGLTKGKSFKTRNELLRPGQTTIEALKEIVGRLITDLSAHFPSDGETDWDPATLLDGLFQILEMLGDSNQEHVYAYTVEHLDAVSKRNSGLERELVKLESYTADDYLITDEYQTYINTGLADSQMTAESLIGKLQSIGEALEKLRDRGEKELLNVKSLAKKERCNIIDTLKKEALEALREESRIAAGKAMQLCTEDPETVKRKQDMQQKVERLAGEVDAAASDGANLKASLDNLMQRVKLVEEAAALVEHTSWTTRGCGISEGTSDGVLELLEDIKARVRRNYIAPSVREADSNHRDREEEELRGRAMERTFQVQVLESRRKELEEKLRSSEEQLRQVLEPRPMHKVLNERLQAICTGGIAACVRMVDPPEINSQNGKALFVAITEEFEKMCEENKPLQQQLHTYSDIVRNAQATLRALAERREKLIDHIQLMREHFVNEAMSRKMDIPDACAWMAPDNSMLRMSEAEKRQLFGSMWDEQQHKLFEGSEALAGRKGFADELVQFALEDIQKMFQALESLSKRRYEHGVAPPQEFLDALRARASNRVKASVRQALEQGNPGANDLPAMTRTRALVKSQTVEQQEFVTKDIPVVEYLDGDSNQVLQNATLHEALNYKNRLEFHINKAWGLNMHSALSWLDPQTGDRRRQLGTRASDVHPEEADSEPVDDDSDMEERLSESAQEWYSTASSRDELTAGSGDSKGKGIRKPRGGRIRNAASTPNVSLRGGKVKSGGSSGAKGFARTVLTVARLGRRQKLNTTSPSSSPAASPQTSPPNRQSGEKTRKLFRKPTTSGIGNQSFADAETSSVGNSSLSGKEAQHVDPRNVSDSAQDIGEESLKDIHRLLLASEYGESFTDHIAEAGIDGTKIDGSESESDEPDADLKVFRTLHARSKEVAHEAEEALKRGKTLTKMAGGLPLDPVQISKLLSGSQEAVSVKDSMRAMIQDHLTWFQSRQHLGEYSSERHEDKQEIAHREMYARLKHLVAMTGGSEDQRRPSQDIRPPGGPRSKARSAITPQSTDGHLGQASNGNDCSDPLSFGNDVAEAGLQTVRPQLDFVREVSNETDC